jgi:hypothetical protein
MRRRSITALLSLALGVSACAYYDEYGHGGYPAAYGDYRYDGDSYGPGRRADTGFGGRGGPILDPWLVHTDEGRDVVLLGFDENGNGRISEETAHRANVWFRRYADTDRDMRLTDEEIRIGLAQAAQRGRGGGL